MEKMLIIYQNGDRAVISGEVVRMEPKGDRMAMEISDPLIRPVSKKTVNGTVCTSFPKDLVDRMKLTLHSRVIMECESSPEIDILPYGGETESTSFTLKGKRLGYTGFYKYESSSRHPEEYVIAGTIVELKKGISKQHCPWARVAVSVRCGKENRVFHVLCFGDNINGIKENDRIAFVTGTSKPDRKDGSPIYTASKFYSY